MAVVETGAVERNEAKVTDGAQYCAFLSLAMNSVRHGAFLYICIIRAYLFTNHGLLYHREG